MNPSPNQGWDSLADCASEASFANQLSHFRTARICHPTNKSSRIRMRFAWFIYLGHLKFRISCPEIFIIGVQKFQICFRRINRMMNPRSVCSRRSSDHGPLKMAAMIDKQDKQGKQLLCIESNSYSISL